MWASGGKRGFLDTANNPKMLEGMDKVAAFRAAHGYNNAGVLIQTSCLVLVASNVPDKEAALAGMKGAVNGTPMLYEYEYESNHSADDLCGLIEALQRENEGPFGSLAIACHNGAGAGGALLNLSPALVLDQQNLKQDLMEALDVKRVMRALGSAVKPKGRVELVACRLGATTAGKALLDKLGAETSTVFMASEPGRTGQAAGRAAAGSSSHRGLVADTLADTHRGASAHGFLADSSPAGKATPIVDQPFGPAQH